MSRLTREGSRLEPLVVALCGATAAQTCSICLQGVASHEVHVAVSDDEIRHHLHGPCAAAAEDPEMRRYGRAVAKHLSEMAA